MESKIALFNQKGGCAKTTSVINISGSLAKRGYKVLIVDCDPQANTSKALTMELEREPEYSIVDVLNGTVDINDAIVNAPICTRSNAKAKDVGIDILVTERSMANISLESDYVLKDAISNVDKDYDFILFDCPPYMSVFTVNILAASDSVLVPATVDDDSLDGYGELVDTISVIKAEGINPALNIMGVFLTIYVARESFDSWLTNGTKDALGTVYIDTPIRRSTYAKQVRHFGRPLCWLKPTSPVAMDYELLVDNILERI